MIEMMIMMTTMKEMMSDLIDGKTGLLGQHMHLLPPQVVFHLKINIVAFHFQKNGPKW